MLKSTLIVVLFSCMLNKAHTAPAKSLQYDPEESAGFNEGDMVLQTGRNGLIPETRRWPNRQVRYKIVGDFDKVHRSAITDAIHTLEMRTCVRFVEANQTDEHYVAISSQPGGCYSAVGYQERVQEMNLEVFPLNNGCFRRGTILHEFMHVLGFYHEQSSADRDEYVRVLYENIIEGKEFNFRKYGRDEVTDFGVGYDYSSCLHYRRGAFSANGEDTLVPLDGEAEVGQRDGLSKKDIDKINVMYKCIIAI